MDDLQVIRPLDADAGVTEFGQRVGKRCARCEAHGLGVLQARKVRADADVQIAGHRAEPAAPASAAACALVLGHEHRAINRRCCSARQQNAVGRVDAPADLQMLRPDAGLERVAYQFCIEYIEPARNLQRLRAAVLFELDAVVYQHAPARGIEDRAFLPGQKVRQQYVQLLEVQPRTASKLSEEFDQDVRFDHVSVRVRVVLMVR